MPSTEDLTTPIASATRCTACGAFRDAGRRLPNGWKRRNDEVFCKSCWTERRVLRAIIIPVASPGDATWHELDTAADLMFRQTTSAANWMVTQLYALDVRRMPGDSKMPPMARTYLYPAARRQFPELPPQSLAALERAVTRAYRAKRCEVVWTCSAALPTFRFPQPFPVHNQNWAARLEQDWPVVDVPVGRRRYSLRLNGGPRFSRHTTLFQQIVAGIATPGELSLYRSGNALMCKIVAWFPREAAAGPRSGTLSVRAAPDSLLAAYDEHGRCVWRYYADHARRWSAEHREMLRRLAEDRKTENGPGVRHAKRLETLTAKYHRRMKTVGDQTAAHLARFAVRRRYAAIRYIDEAHSYCEQFPWRALKDRLAKLADEQGIRFTTQGQASAAN